MNVSWQPPVDGEGAGQAADYLLNVTLPGAPGEDRYSARTDSTSVVVGSLHPDYLYQCSVVPRTSAGPGPLTQTLLQLPPDGKNPLSLSLSLYREISLCVLIMQCLPVPPWMSMLLHLIPQLSTSIGAHLHRRIRMVTSSSMGSISLTLSRGRPISTTPVVQRHQLSSPTSILTIPTSTW